MIKFQKEPKIWKKYPRIQKKTNEKSLYGCHKVRSEKIEPLTDLFLVAVEKNGVLSLLILT